MDWGLFDKGAGDNRFLREEIVYAYKVKGVLKCTIYDKEICYTLTFDIKMDRGMFDK